MIWIIASSLSLLAMTGGLMLLNKTKKEGLSAMYKWSSIFIVTAAFLGFMCAVGQAGSMAYCMRYCDNPAECGPAGMMNCPPSMCGPMRGGHMGMGKCHGEGMEKCHGGDMKECGDGEMDCCKGMGMEKCKENMEGGKCCKGHGEDEGEEHGEAGCSHHNMKIEKHIEKDTVIIKH